MAPTIAVVVVYQALRRAGNFAFARSTREVLFTIVPREDKYKARASSIRLSIDRAIK